MKRVIFLTVSSLFLVLICETEAAIFLESQQREITLDAKAGAVESAKILTATGFGPFNFNTSVSRSEPQGDGPALGILNSDIGPGTIGAFAHFALSGGFTLPLDPDSTLSISASYHYLFNLVFSVTDSPLDISIFMNNCMTLSGVGLFDLDRGQQITGISSDPNALSLITLQTGRYRLSDEGILELTSTPSQGGFFTSTDDEFFSLAMSYDGETFVVPEPASALLWCCFTGITLVCANRMTRKGAAIG